MAHVSVSAGLSLITLATLLSIFALVLDYWDKTFGTNGVFVRFEIRRGLWKICTSTEYRSQFYPDEKHCFYNDPNTATADGILLELIRTLLILAVVVFVGSLICTVLKLAFVTERYNLLNIAWILAFTGGSLVLSAFVAYMNIGHLFKDYMVAFYLAVISWAMSWAAGFFIFVASRQKD